MPKNETKKIASKTEEKGTLLKFSPDIKKELHGRKLKSGRPMVQIVEDLIRGEIRFSQPIEDWLSHELTQSGMERTEFLESILWAEMKKTKAARASSVSTGDARTDSVNNTVQGALGVASRKLRKPSS
jgi:hypothetical protein